MLLHEASQVMLRSVEEAVRLLHIPSQLVPLLGAGIDRHGALGASGLLVAPPESRGSVLPRLEVLA